MQGTLRVVILNGASSCGKTTLAKIIAEHTQSNFENMSAVLSGVKDIKETVERAKQVNMTYIYQGHIEKVPILEEILRDSGIAADQVAYMGDDLTDVVIMRRVGLSIATANARPEVKKCAMYTTGAAGGQGAVREVIELILKAQGHWDELLRKYEVICPSE